LEPERSIRDSSAFIELDEDSGGELIEEFLGRDGKSRPTLGGTQLKGFYDRFPIFEREKMKRGKARR